MNLASFTDAVWKRVALAVLVSLAIIFSLRTFASSSDIETQKVQLESARDQHCEKWQISRQNGDPQAECVRWSN